MHHNFHQQYFWWKEHVLWDGGSIKHCINGATDILNGGVFVEQLAVLVQKMELGSSMVVQLRKIRKTLFV